MSKHILACNVIHEGRSYKKGDKPPAEFVALFKEKGFFDESEHAPAATAPALDMAEMKKKHPALYDEIFYEASIGGHKRGYAEGIDKGFAEGHEKGLAEGLARIESMTPAEPEELDLLASNAEQIKAALPDCSDETLLDLLEREEAGKNRKGVIEAINAEIDLREGEE